MASLDKPFTGVLDDLQRQLRKNPEYDDLLNLGLGNPGFRPDKELLHTPLRIIEAQGDARYASTIGSLETRLAMLRFLDEVRHTPYRASNDGAQIAITHGITEAVRDYLRTLNDRNIRAAGDTMPKPLEVLAPVPSYAWHLDTIKKIPRAKAIKMPTRDSDWKLTPDTLQKTLQEHPDADALLLNYPSNPTGQNLSQTQWQALADVLETHAKHHPNFRIILDNAYKDLQFGPPTGLFEVASDALKQHIIEFNSVAKFHGISGQGGPGFAASENTKDIAMLRGFESANQGLGADEALLRKAFSKKYYSEDRVGETVGRFRRRCTFVANYINKQLLPKYSNSRIVLEPDGGMFVFADFSRWLGKPIKKSEAKRMKDKLAEMLPRYSDYFEEEVFKCDKNMDPRINDDKDLALYLTMKAHVVTIPGQDFGNGPDEGMLRIAIGDIGKLTSSGHSRRQSAQLFAPYLPEETDLHTKSLNDLRKLKEAMDRSIGALQTLDRSRAR